MILIFCVFLLNPLVYMAEAAKRKSVNLNLETVMEFDDKNVDSDVKTIDQVQKFLTKVRVILDKNKENRRNFNNDKVVFIDFLEHILSLLITYSDDELEEMSTILDDELRKYHYKGCKVYEMLKNNKFRKFVSDMLYQMRRTQARDIRKLLRFSLKKLQNSQFDEKDMEFIRYLNSLYRADAKEKMYNVLKSFEEFRRSSAKSRENLVTVIRKCIRAIFFDHYSNLNSNARKDLRSKIAKYFTESTEKRNNENDDTTAETHSFDDKSDNNDTEEVTEKSNPPTDEVEVVPVRNLKKEKEKMPLRFISLYTEVISSTSVKPVTKKRSSKHGRPHKRQKVGLLNEPTFWEKPKETHKKHERQVKISKRPKTVMVVKEDRPLREILTEHNAVIEVMSSRSPALKEAKKEKYRTHHKKTHGRHSKSKHKRNSNAHKDVERQKDDSNIDSTTKTNDDNSHRRDQQQQGLSIESFEDNILEGHYVYRKRDGELAIKRSRVSDLSRTGGESGYRKSNLRIASRKHKSIHKNAKYHHGNKTRHNKHANNKNLGKIAIAEATMDTEYPTNVSDAFIIKLVHKLEKQLANVITKLENQTEKRSTTNSTTDSKPIATNDSSFRIVNRSKIYEDIETTPKLPIIPFWTGTVKTTTVYSIDFSSSSSSEEREKPNIIVSETNTTSNNIAITDVHKADKNSSNVQTLSGSTRYNDEIDTEDFYTETLKVARSAKSNTYKKSSGSSTSVLPTTANGIIDDNEEKVIEKNFAIVDTADIQENLTDTKDADTDKDKFTFKGVYRNKTFVEYENKNKKSTRNDLRKVNADIDAISTNKYSNNETSTSITKKTTKKHSEIENNTDDKHSSKSKDKSAIKSPRILRSIAGKTVASESISKFKTNLITEQNKTNTASKTNSKIDKTSIKVTPSDASKNVSHTANDILQHKTSQEKSFTNSKEKNPFDSKEVLSPKSYIDVDISNLAK